MATLETSGVANDLTPGQPVPTDFVPGFFPTHVRAKHANFYRFPLEMSGGFKHQMVQEVTRGMFHYLFRA